MYNTVPNDQALRMPMVNSAPNIFWLKLSTRVNLDVCVSLTIKRFARNLQYVWAVKRFLFSFKSSYRI